MTRYTNIRSRFLQSWKLARSLVLFSTLLVFSSFSFSQNLLTNPGFESGTSGWTLDGDASAQFTESNGRSGSRLTHWSSSASYTAETKQTVTGLAAGTYRLSVYTVGGEASGAWLWAYCDGQSFSTPIPSSPWGSWAQVVVDNIPVSGGSCELGITTENSEWSSFDDVVFEWVSGGGPGEIVIEESTGFCDVDGSVDSNHSGYNGNGFANTANAAGNGAEWRVQVPAGGSYQLEWRYANASENNRAGSVVVNGNAVATVDFPSTGAWETWAVATVTISLAAGENTIRLEAVSGEGLGNIDSLSVTGDSPQAISCGNNSGDNGSAGCGSAADLSSGRHSITVDGLHREYIIHVPGNYDANNPYRLVFDWHALNMSAQQIADGWDNPNSLVARSNGTAIFVAPDRYVSPGGQDDSGWPNTNGRDMDFLRAMLDEFNNALCIDQDRIFSVGFSYGGMMSLAVGREMGDVFRAIAPMAGGFMTPHNNSGLPMAAWIASGTQDSLYSRGVEARDYFVSANSCSSSTVPVSPSPCVEYQGCGDHPVVWCAWNGGHSTPPFASSAIWDFFSRF